MISLIHFVDEYVLQYDEQAVDQSGHIIQHHTGHKVDATTTMQTKSPQFTTN
jgi:hypothetical protein